jgi:Glycosyltransferase 61
MFFLNGLLTSLKGRATALDNQLVYTEGWRSGPIGCPLSSPFVQKGLAALSSRPVKHLKSYQATQFPMLVAGDASRYLPFGGFADPLSAVRYRQFVFATRRITLPDGEAVDPPLILVRLKSHRHRILNVPELVQFLRRRYPGARVFAYDPAKLGGNAEIELMSRTSVLVTPAGGGSFGAVFLPDGAAAIFLDICWPCAAKADNSSVGLQSYDPLNGTQICCAKLESYLWSKMPFLDLYYTHRDPSTLIFDHKYDFRPQVQRHDMVSLFGLLLQS